MARKRKGNPVHGWVNLDKPLELGSTQAVGRIRRLFNAQKVGHAGTLDPLATGVLPIALGDATKTVPFMQDAAKAYTVEVTWGEHRDTLDAEGAVLEMSDMRPSEADIMAVLPNFIGHIAQIPPKYSAIKIDGKRAYDLARGGKEVEMVARTVTIDNITLTATTPDTATFDVACGKGTYIRSFARDIAECLGTVGYVSVLRRSCVGAFTVARAFSLDALEKLAYEGRVLEALEPVETPLDDIPVVVVTDKEATDLRHGRAIARPDISSALDSKNSDWVCVMYKDKALALCIAGEGLLAPKRVFHM